IVLYHAYLRDLLARDYTYLVGTPLHFVFRNLNAGVPCFFVLSGFVLFLPFARAAIAQRGAQPPGHFLRRRALRILPAYYLALGVVWAARYTGARDQWVDLLEHLTFTHVFDPRHLSTTIGPAWSLGVEAFYYLLLAAVGPLAYLLCGRLAVRARYAALVAIPSLLVLASAAFKWWAVYRAHVAADVRYFYYNLLPQADSFALGMLLAVAVAAGWPRLGDRG